MAADRFDLGRDIEGAAPLGALEGHMLQQMRDAVDRRRLVPRADIDPDTDRHRLDRIHAVGDDAHAVGEFGDLDAHDAAPAVCAARAWART